MRDLLFEEHHACRIPLWILMHVPAQTLGRERARTCKCQTEAPGPAIAYPQQAIC